MNTFRAAAASTAARWGDLRGNLTKISAAMERAAEDGARLLLLPECCLTGGDWPTGAKDPTPEATALEADGPVLREIARAAGRMRLVVAVGYYERRDGGVTISQALIGPKGVLGVYRKVHEPSRPSREAEPFPVFDLGFARVGFAVCRDVMLPEHARILALKGAEVLLAPFMSLPLTRRAWALERLLPLRARAQDNRMFVLSASHAMPHVPGRPSEWGYSGICCAVNPLGEVISISRGRAGRPQRLTVTLDKSLRRTYFLGDAPTMYARRPKDYAPLTDEAVQEAYRRLAPPFRYSESDNRVLVAKRRKQRETQETQDSAKPVRQRRSQGPSRRPHT